MVVHSEASPSAPDPLSAQVRVTLGLQIPMRDGGRLAATLYRPRDVVGPVPAVLEITPYGRDGGHRDAVRIAAAGFAVVAADCRGRGDSPGTFEQLVHEGRDGYDAVEWVAARPWCTGDVAMYGGSYTGMNQWLTAAERPPHLRTIVPGMAAVLGLDSPRGGIPALWELMWLVMVEGRSTAAALAWDRPLWHAVVQEQRRLGLADKDLPGLVGLESDDFDRVATQPGWGPHWQALLPAAEGAVDVPALSITGHHDNAQHGALLHHDRFLDAAARSRSHLVIGPWDHATCLTGTDRVGDLAFGPEAAVDVAALIVEWYRWIMQGGARPPFLRHPVMVYLAGAETWTGARTLAALSGDVATWHMHPPGPDHDAFRSGLLAGEPAPAGEASFRSAPGDTVTGALETASVAGEPRSLFTVTAGEDPTDQAFSLAIDGLGVAWHSRPLPGPMDVAGRPELDLWLSLDGPDADLAALLSEVRADGSAIVLSSQLLRLGSGNEDVDLRTDGSPFRVPWRSMRLVARRLAPGSRLRLVVRATGSLAVGEPAAPATVTVHHGPDHPSCLRLPLLAVDGVPPDADVLPPTPRPSSEGTP